MIMVRIRTALQNVDLNRWDEGGWGESIMMYPMGATSELFGLCSDSRREKWETSRMSVMFVLGVNGVNDPSNLDRQSTVLLPKASTRSTRGRMRRGEGGVGPDPCSREKVCSKH